MSLIVDTSIPAGNAIIESVDGDVITFRPDLRTTLEPWFYWNFRVRGCAGRRLRIVCSVEHSMTIKGAAVSADRGRSWTWIEDYDPEQWAFTYACDDADELWFSLAMPYTRRDLDWWLAGHQGDPGLETSELCLSNGGRSVPLLRVGPRDGSERYQMVITCRHHCCEMMASYVLEGLVDAVLHDAIGSGLRDRCLFLIAPLMDLDGVETGDQGKRRAPHDHNRDYFDTGLYAETRALRQLVTERCDNRFTLALDLHCPWVRGAEHNQEIYIVGSKNQDNWQRQVTFADTLAAHCTGPLPFEAESSLPYGQAWNVGDSFSPGMTCSGWMLANGPENLTAATMEFPYADAKGVAIDVESARAFGRDLAKAIDAWSDR